MVLNQGRGISHGKCRLGEWRVEYDTSIRVVGIERSFEVVRDNAFALPRCTRDVTRF